MLNLRPIYKRAEEHTGWIIGGMFFLLAFFILLQTLFSPSIVFAFLFCCGALALAVFRPLWMIGVLSLYLPFESLILKFTPDDAYVMVRYASEGLIYVMVGVVLLRVITRSIQVKETPLDLPFVLFVLTLMASTVINLVSPSIAILGMRQILRFVLMFFLVVYLKPSKEYIQRLTYALFAILVFVCVIGFAQSVVGERLDLFLLPSESRSFGDMTLTSGVTQFWDPGSRIFATFGRYDRLGNFLYLFLLLATGFFFVKQGPKTQKWIPFLLILGIFALVLTFSRASWFAFLFGFLFVGIFVMRDRRVLVSFLAFALIVSSYVALSGLSVRYITEAPGQTVVERFYESFSIARWRGEYYGLGRVYWAVQTPLVVVPFSPFVGVGPGQFGGGVAAALHNTKIYDALGLPFGVYGIEGHIDNNWFSLWGETGTIGFALYIWMFVLLFRFAMDTYHGSKDPYTKALALGFAACIIGISFNGLTSMVFEIRTTAYYFWLYAGFVVVLGEREEVKKRRSREGEA